MSKQTKAAPKAQEMLGPLPVVEGDTAIDRIAIFIWGQSGVGKTTFAATAPGVKLWLSFGDQEHVSVSHRDDVKVVQAYSLDNDALFNQIQNMNPFNLDSYLAEHTEIETVVCDSLTAIAYRALQKAVDKGIGKGSDFRPTMEFPGESAYGGRNGICIAVLQGLLRITAKHGVHLIVTAHEADPKTKNEKGNEIIDYVSVMLGGQIVSNVAHRLSEIWYMSESELSDRRKMIAIRPTRRRKPMKTRMFVTTEAPDFELVYDPTRPDEEQKNMTIAGWYEAWRDSGGKKQPLPELKEKQVKKK